MAEPAKSLVYAEKILNVIEQAKEELSDKDYKFFINQSILWLFQARLNNYVKE